VTVRVPSFPGAEFKGTVENVGPIVEAKTRTVKVRVAYALYDHLPLLCKWVTVENSGIQPIKVDQVVNEVLAMPEEESAVVGSAEKMKKPQGIYVESNFAFTGWSSCQIMFIEC